MSSTPALPLVLLVEDSEDDAFFFSRALRKTGLECTLRHLRDGVGALRYFGAAYSQTPTAETPRPDLVFLDLKLPASNGFEILQWLRQHADPALPVTILSGSDDRGDRERARVLGAADYVVKPVSADYLRAQLDAWQRQTSPSG